MGRGHQGASKGTAQTPTDTRGDGRSRIHRTSGKRSFLVTIISLLFFLLYETDSRVVGLVIYRVCFLFFFLFFFFLNKGDIIAGHFMSTGQERKMEKGILKEIFQLNLFALGGF